MPDTQTSPAPPIADQAKEQVQHIAAAGKQAGAQAVEQGKQMAGSLLDRGREQVKTQLGTQKDNLSTGLNDVAQALLLSSNHLQEQGQGGVAHYGDQAAEKITQMAGYLRERDVDQVLGELDALARRKPGLIIGGAVLLGLIAARFLKSGAVAVAQSATPASPQETPAAAPQSALAAPEIGDKTEAAVPDGGDEAPSPPQEEAPDGRYAGVGVGHQETAGRQASNGSEANVGVRDGNAS